MHSQRRGPPRLQYRKRLMNEIKPCNQSTISPAFPSPSSFASCEIVLHNLNMCVSENQGPSNRANQLVFAFQVARQRSFSHAHVACVFTPNVCIVYTQAQPRSSRTSTHTLPLYHSCFPTRLPIVTERRNKARFRHLANQCEEDTHTHTHIFTHTHRRSTEK